MSYKCEHNIYKSHCKECKGGHICEHNKRRSCCKECGGSQICEHNRYKGYCKECGGSQICEHNKIKAICKQCHGSRVCNHNKLRPECKNCNGNEICIHNKRKSTCKECKGSQICQHNKRRYECKECKGTGICKHNILRYRCKECKGTGICKHNKNKYRCKECNGSQLCNSSWCETRSNIKYEGYCLNCYIHLFPDKPNTKNYKTKEKATAEYILDQFPVEKYSWITDKKVQDGCSRKRPDLLLDLGYQVIIIEVDENQHQTYDCSCENKRLMLLSQDVNHRPIIFIRFNPDDYNTKTEKITSCWKNNKLGICTIKKTKKIEWNRRLESLKSQIEYWINPENKTDKTVEVIHLFYDTE